MIKENFKPQDLSAAKKEIDCIEDLLTEIKVHMQRGSYARAEICAEDLITSVRELRKMENTKKNHDKLMEVVNSMSARGINLEVVARNA